MNTTDISIDERVKKLQEDFESGKIKSNEISKDDAMLLSFIYQLKTIELEAEIECDDIILDNYKERLKKAIAYLKKKKNYED